MDCNSQLEEVGVGPVEAGVNPVDPGGGGYILVPLLLFDGWIPKAVGAVDTLEEATVANGRDG